MDKTYPKKLINFLITGFNFLALIVFVLIVKLKEEKIRVFNKVENEEKIIPIEKQVLEKQNLIFIERENKLRALNNTAKALKKEVTITTTTTITPDQKVTPKPDNKTKTS